MSPESSLHIGRLLDTGSRRITAIDARNVAGNSSSSGLGRNRNGWHVRVKVNGNSSLIVDQMPDEQVAFMLSRRRLQLDAALAGAVLVAIGL